MFQWIARVEEPHLRTRSKMIILEQEYEFKAYLGAELNAYFSPMLSLHLCKHRPLPCPHNKLNISPGRRKADGRIVLNMAELSI